MSLLYKLFGMLLKIIFDIVQDYGMAIVIFSIITKVLTLPLLIKQTKSTKHMNDLQPKMQLIQDKYKNDKNKQAEMLQKFYAEEKYNPLSGCLPLLIQFPIIIALFNVIRSPVPYVFTAEQFALIGQSFMWLPDLGKPDPIYLLPIISAVTTYIQSKMMMTKQPAGAAGANQAQMMTNMMPIMILFMSLKFPSGLVLYWVMGNLFSIVQQYIMLNSNKTDDSKANTSKPNTNKPKGV